MSEMYGRMPIYNACNVLFIVFNIACALSNSMGMLIAFRLLAGCAGASPLTLGAGTIADMFPTQERAGAMAIYSMGPLLGPIIGPVCGGFLVENMSWRWVFWILAIFGGVFGLFMSSMRYDTPMSTNATGTTIASLPVKEQLRQGFKEMGRASWSSAKNFGYIGAIFAGTECAIEGYRAKNDLGNGVAAGCLTGGFLAKGGGPQAAALGCAGFAAFSAAIDAYMRMPSDDVGSDPII